MTDTDVIKAAQQFMEKRQAKMAADPFHNFNHTQAVVSAAEAIGQANLLNQEEMKTLLLAAWLYDSGYADASNQQEASELLATDFLTDHGVAPQEINRVVRCIRAAKEPQSPQTIVEEVFCDALASFLATEDYLRLVMEHAGKQAGKNGAEAEWLKKQKDWLTNQIFYTSYARQTFLAGKEKNASLLKQRRKEIKQEMEALEEAKKETKKLKKEEEKEKEQKASKGIETLFRTTMASHLQLSVMADSKANLMISINAIIASIMVSSFVRKFEEVPELMLPTIFLTLVCILTIVFAVLSTRPNIKTQFVQKEKPDMLFFGDFTQLKPEVYKEGIRKIMRDNDLLYDSMIDNIYSQGKVLTKKYRLLKIAYTIFMFGFTIVLISYALALIFSPSAGK